MICSHSDRIFNGHIYVYIPNQATPRTEWGSRQEYHSGKCYIITKYVVQEMQIFHGLIKTCDDQLELIRDDSVLDGGVSQHFRGIYNDEEQEISAIRREESPPDTTLYSILFHT